MDRTYGYGRDFHTNEGSTYLSDYVPKKREPEKEKSPPTKKEQLEQKLKQLL